MLRVSQVKHGKMNTIKRGLAGGIAIAISAGVMATSTASADSLDNPEITALEEAAAEYIRYREDVAVIEATPFDNAAATRDAHKRLAAHDSKDLSSGWVSYAALVAADTPEFAEALQREVKSNKKYGKRKLKGKDAFFAKLSADPSYPRKLDGAQSAIDRVLTMTAQDARRFTTLGEAFKSQAYAMQKTKWGKKRIAASSKRIGEATDYASARPSATPPAIEPATDDGVTMPTLASADDNWAHDWGADSASGRMSDTKAQVIIDRVLNLAARYAVGGMNEKIVEVYSKNNKSERCLSMAKLTLTQCIARTPYEEAFCLGEHGLNDIGSCVGWVAGAGAS